MHTAIISRTLEVSETEQHLDAGDWPRHRHAHPYAAIVVDGSYSEYGDTGRWHYGAGDVVVHRGFSAHGNMVARSGARVMNLPLPYGLDLPDVFQIADPDQLVRAVRSGDPDAVSLLKPVSVRAPLALDWQDELSARLRRGTVGLGEWAARAKLAPGTLSRGFRSAFGVTPARYRAEMQAHRALAMILAGREPLATVAALAGFADQPHMSRAISRLTGRSPGAWRRVKTVQDRSGPRD